MEKELRKEETKVGESRLNPVSSRNSIHFISKDDEVWFLPMMTEFLVREPRRGLVVPPSALPPPLIRSDLV